MMSLRDSQGIRKLKVILMAPQISFVGTAESCDAYYVNLRAKILIGAQHDTASTDLEMRLVHGKLAQQRGESADQSMVFGQRRPSHAGIVQRAGIKRVSRFTIVVEGIAKRGCVLSKLLVQPP